MNSKSNDDNNINITIFTPTDLHNQSHNQQSQSPPQKASSCLTKIFFVILIPILIAIGAPIIWEFLNKLPETKKLWATIEEYRMLAIQFLPYLIQTLAEVAIRLLACMILFLGWCLMAFQPHIVWHWGRR